ncbi:hypothetical protein BC830DRAFT_1101868 [Chytriomyces sp. MP71]|nr:hypothetical protein BC830DRAFT_1101868 [Chytriomyces sp. MP71]
MSTMDMDIEIDTSFASSNATQTSPNAQMQITELLPTPTSPGPVDSAPSLLNALTFDSILSNQTHNPSQGHAIASPVRTHPPKITLKLTPRVSQQARQNSKSPGPGSFPSSPVSPHKGLPPKQQQGHMQMHQSYVTGDSAGFLGNLHNNCSPKPYPCASAKSPSPPILQANSPHMMHLPLHTHSTSPATSLPISSGLVGGIDIPRLEDNNISISSMLSYQIPPPHAAAAERLTAPTPPTSCADLLKSIPPAAFSIHCTHHNTPQPLEPHPPQIHCGQQLKPPPILFNSTQATQASTKPPLHPTQPLTQLPRPNRRPKKRAMPHRSLPRHLLAQHATPYDREIAGITQLDVYALFRTDPRSLLVTLQDDAGCGGGDESDEAASSAPGTAASGDDYGGLEEGFDGVGERAYVGSARLAARRRAGAAGAVQYDSGVSLSGGGGGYGGGGSSQRQRMGALTSKRRSNSDLTASGGLNGEGVRAVFGVERYNSAPSGGGSNISPKRRRVNASPSKPSSWTTTAFVPGGSGGEGSSSSSRYDKELSPPGSLPPAISRARAPAPKPTNPNGEKDNDKSRILPFEIISQGQIEEFTACKERGDTVTWKKTPIQFPEDSEGYSKLDPDEIETCSILRVPPADYLQVKTILLSARAQMTAFTKRQAQKWYGIDVNKTGKIFDWFVSKNWLLLPNKGAMNKKDGKEGSGGGGAGASGASRR